MASYWHRRCARCDSVDLGLTRFQQEEGLVDAPARAAQASPLLVRTAPAPTRVISAPGISPARSGDALLL